MSLSKNSQSKVSLPAKKIKKASKNSLSKNGQLLDFSRLETEDILKSFKTSAKGLAEAEARRRIFEYGSNVLAQEKSMSAFLEFLSKFKSPLIILLIFAAAVSAFFGQIINASIIAVMVFLSAFLDFIEERNAGQSAKKLLETVKTSTMVRRAGREREVSVASIVPGDIIILNSGDLVPADARIISLKDFFVNQSSLTGESEPCKKKLDLVDPDKKSLSELSNIVFAGTNVVSGQAEVVVLKTGTETEFGKIAYTLSHSTEKSEFEIGITHFGFLVMKAMMFLVLFIFLFNALIDRKVLESFLFAVAIAVGITPELLPVIMSVTMSRGSVQMSKKGVIVKKLSAIPTFGGLDVLCTDKTGTLTDGKIALVKYVDCFGADSDKVLRLAYLNSFLQTGIENPLDDAVVGYKDIDVSSVEKVDEIPFDFVRKRLSVIVNDNSQRLLISKGAPEEIFNCSNQFCRGGDGEAEVLNDEVRKQAISLYRSLSSQGYRVLALAVKKVGVEKQVYDKEDENSLVLCGFIGFLDPPKKDAKEAIQSLKQVGIEIKVITGDNELVAGKICQEIDLPIKGVMLGCDIDTLTNDALRHRVERTTIFARFSPNQKNRVILALKANKHVVGYMGDGINDAPSLKTADVGISVNNAVDVAKESADIILTVKSLKVLHDGVIEGRKVFGNTMKYIMMGLSSNFGNMFSAAGAVIFLPFLPMLPIQILLNNFIYDFSQITIPSDKVDDDWVQKPKRWNIHFIKRFMFTFGSISSFFDFLTFFVLYYVFRLTDGAFQTGWFLESIATQTLVIHIIRTKKIPFIQSRPSNFLLFSTFGGLATAWLIPWTPIGDFFGLTHLPWQVLLTIVGIVLTYLLTVQIGKKLFYKKNEF